MTMIEEIAALAKAAARLQMDRVTGRLLAGLREFKWAAATALLFGVCALTVRAAELTLADNGRTDYKVVIAENADRRSRAAAADLAATLAEITGADFTAAAGKSRSIFVGVAAPGDKEPLKEFERRIVVQDGNLYLYGEGECGSGNAVYDFLRDELGCRWFNVSGDRKIPKRSRLVVGELRKSLIPSIPYLTAGHVNSRAPDILDFARRNAILDELDNFVGKSHLHAGQRIIPSGRIPVGGNLGNLPGPIACLKDKAYFDAHPEYFSMNAQGKRTFQMHLCYSNKEMRDEYVRNLEIMLAADNYQGGRKLLGVGQDDIGGAFCFCPACKALEKKYDHPAGAYYDFLLDLSARFAKRHPQVVLCFLAYRDTQTLRPAKCLEKLPRNLLPSYAPLGCDFTKPLDFRPNNAVQDDGFRAWAAIAEHLHWWSYPTPYPRPIVSFPLLANLHRLAVNIRLAHKYKAAQAYCQFGAGLHNNFGFNDLRAYLLAQLCRDIHLDEKAVIAEYANACYGKAAPRMLDYLAELERLEAGTTFYLRWNPDVLHLPYATGANLLRWERDFDAMEKLAAEDARALLNIRRARYNLDQTLIARWPYLTPELRQAAGSLETLVARAGQTLVDDQRDLYKGLRTAAPAKYRRLVEGGVKWHRSGLDQFIARARGGKPLPPQFASHKTIYRILPDRNKQALDVDPDAPFGLSNRGAFPVRGRSWFFLRSFDAKRRPAWRNILPPLPLAARRTRDRLDGNYHYLHLGKMPIEADSRLVFPRISPQSGFSLAPVFDPGRPKRRYNFVVLVAFAPDKSWVKVAELLVIPLDEDAASTPREAGGEIQDEFR